MGIEVRSEVGEAVPWNVHVFLMKNGRDTLSDADLPYKATRCRHLNRLCLACLCTKRYHPN